MTVHHAIREQPAPEPQGEPIALEFLDDGPILARLALGSERYGAQLTAHNGRDALVDAYQELLDATVYVAQAMLEGKDVGPLMVAVAHARELAEELLP